MFSAARFSFCSRKQRCPQGGESTSGVGAFQKGGKPRRDRNFRNREASGLSLKFRCDGKNRKPRGGKGGRPAKKRPGRLPLFGKLFSRGTCPFPRPLRAVRAIVQSRFYQSESVQRGVPGGKDRPGNAEYVAKLTAFHAQFRAVGTNYNQVVKELHAHFFPRRKTLALLYKTGESDT